MSHQKLQEALDHFINGDTEKAQAIFHDIIVGKARSIYEELEASIEEELAEESDEEVSDEEEVVSESGEFIDDVVADVDGDEMDPEDMVEPEVDPDADFEMGDDEDSEPKDEVEELSDKMDELLDMFKDFMDDERDEPEHSDGDAFDPDFDEMDDKIDDMKSESFMDEQLEEATDFLDKVADPGMKDEGKYEGTGDKSENFNPNVDSLFTDEPSKKEHGGEPHENKDGSHGDQKPMKAKPESKYDSKHNVKVEPSSAPKAEEKPSKDDKSAGSIIDGK